MTRSLLATLAVVMFGLVGSASAQDRLFVVDGVTPQAPVVELGAFGRFGERLGPAPADALSAMPRVPPAFVVTETTLRHADSGAVVWTAPSGEQIAGPPAATPDRARVFITTTQPSDGSFLINPRIRAIDVASGTAVAETPQWVTRLHWDPVGRRVLAYGWRKWLVFDEHLRPLGELSLGSGSCSYQDLLISAHTGRAYLSYVSEHPSSGYGHGPRYLRLAAFDLAGGRLVADVGLMEPGVEFLGDCPPAVALWSAPAPPEGLQARVSGRDVALSWFAPDLADRYLLEIGLAPGQTDLHYYVGAPTQITFANVPTGVYFVRVRAGNVMGGGRASREIRIVVP